MMGGSNITMMFINIWWPLGHQGTKGKGICASSSKKTISLLASHKCEFNLLGLLTVAPVGSWDSQEHGFLKCQLLAMSEYQYNTIQDYPLLFHIHT